ncbi:cation-translocating P-type ATPase [Cytophaga aurantiaca]|uniref:cation-translocating P-type ATPase n=1 Tax=Cytophaga aurantiaca TaxID=29530 RepID=UPI00037F40ED|nr:cation-translocating P-type ATPase [Cytophaga aurantiaca]
MSIKYPIENAFTLSPDVLINDLQTHTENGLTNAEAETRTKELGQNMYQAQKQKNIWLIFLLQFKSPIVYLLIAAAAVSLYFKDIIEAAAILVVILINAIIGFFMELQARSSMNALKEMDVIKTNVIRDGKKQEIPSENITPGDIVLLEAGDIVPGDGRIIEANQLKCDESSLTGESLPSEKKAEELPAETSLGDQHNMVFKGTSVVNGNGKIIITGIAEHTQLGTITSLVEKSEDQKTPLDKKINSLSKKLIWITLAMTAIFAVTGVVQGKEWVLIFESSIALAVAAFPEGLPIVATIALSHGMLLMAKRNAIVKKLSAVETLGGTNVILTDKTGTLTENKIYVETISFPEEKIPIKIENNTLIYPDKQIEKSKDNFEKMRLIGALCNNAPLENSEQKDDTKPAAGDPIDIALILLANVSGTSAKDLHAQFERIGEVPFNSDIKIMGTLHNSSNGKFVAAKGSVEHLLNNCNKIQYGGEIKDLNEEQKKLILDESEKMASEGLRVIAFAYREGGDINTDNYLSELIHVGMIGFLDPPRTDIKDAILRCRNAGIRIVMITGDHPMTALNIAKKTGLVDENEQNVIIGKDLPEADKVTDEWRQKILATSVFARTTPKQKLEIVEAFQKEGNIVAMTGDGINDAPALKKADIGIAMGLRGTQVAKETAGIVLKDDSFTSIAEAVAHGREIFDNIKKFIIYLFSCNISEIFIVTILGFIAPLSTLLPLQILFLNMVTDIFPALALGVGKGDEKVMEKQPRDSKESIITNKDWIKIALYAALVSVSVVIAVIYCDHIKESDHKIVNNAAFLTLAFAQLFHVFNMSSMNSKLILNDITKNKFVWFATLLCIAIMITVFEIPYTRLVLGLEPLPKEAWIASILCSLIPLIVIQTYKVIFKLIKKNK